MTLTKEQLDTLCQFPKHPGILEALGLDLSPETIVIVSKHGVQIIVPRKPDSEVS